MEPRHEEQKTNEPRPQEKKPKRFRVVKLEERIAPAIVKQVAQPDTRACDSILATCSLANCNVGPMPTWH
jgi:hypothetical protein